MCVLVVLLAGGAEAMRPLPSAAVGGHRARALAATGRNMASAAGRRLSAEVAPMPIGCELVGDLFTNGKDLIESIWGPAFVYTSDETKAYQPDWWGGQHVPPPALDLTNAAYFPNQAVMAKRGLAAPDTCAIQYNHKAAPSSTEGLTECDAYYQHNCCKQESVASPKQINEAYGEGYEWDRCGKLTDACERFFVQEACLYECEPAAGHYRMYSDEKLNGCTAAGELTCATWVNPDPAGEPDAECDPVGQASGTAITLEGDLAYTCDGEENSWALEAMPISGAWADAYYRACKGDHFIGRNFWDVASTWHEDQAALEEALESNQFPDWGAGVIAGSVIAGLLLICFLGFLIFREKRGAPVFGPLEGKPPAAR